MTLTYFTRGFEYFQGDTPQVGIFGRDGEGKIKGHIMIQDKIYLLEGDLIQIGSIWNLMFTRRSILKDINSISEIPAFYQLKKNDGKNIIQGIYEGTYEHLEDGFLHTVKGTSSIRKGEKHKVRLTLDSEF